MSKGNEENQLERESEAEAEAKQTLRLSVYIGYIGYIYIEYFEEQFTYGFFTDKHYVLRSGG
jgi:hypothetical protein